MQTLAVSEQFYSIQGEGPTSGVPAVFLRLKGCNLKCGGPNSTWTCDTIEVWTKGEKVKTHDLILEWDKKGWLSALKNGAHLVITGGEPLLQDEDIVAFLQTYEAITSHRPYIEIETNGTLKPTEALDFFVSQYNVSPKLKNSGMTEAQRLKPDVIRWFNNSPKANFKFVLTSPEDYYQVVDEYTKPFEIQNEKILIMPGAEDRQTLIRKSLDLIELCKRESIRFTSRLQLLFWDKATGV